MELRRIPRQELERRASGGELWICIDGKVYDVTEWAALHPGGEMAIRSFSGQDASHAFLALHPATARRFLPGMLLGSLDGYEPTPLAADHRRVLERLRKAGLLAVPRAFYAKFFAVLGAMLAAVVAGVAMCSSPWVHAVCAFLLGLVWIHSGFIGHDAGHTGIFGHQDTDAWLGLLVGNCLTGISFGWWRRNHNAHHFSCNSVEYDPDLQYMPIFAVSSKFFASLRSHFYDRVMVFDSAARILVRYQHWTFYLVMAVARLNLYAQSFLVVLGPRKLQRRWLELAGLAIFWCWFLCLLSLLPSNGERLAFVLISFATTGIQHIQFCLNHFSSPVYQGRPKGDDEWFYAQSRGTLNLSASPAWDLFHGGLHYQVEHHLFPRLPRPNLRAASPIIRSEIIDKHRLPYSSVSFWEANAMIIRTLRRAAMQARLLDRVSKPAPRCLLWEALNAQG